jgi:hypothetical protein
VVFIEVTKRIFCRKICCKEYLYFRCHTSLRWLPSGWLILQKHCNIRDLRFSWRWVWRSLSSGMWPWVVSSDERAASIFRVQQWPEDGSTNFVLHGGMHLPNYREDFYFVDRFDGSALHGGRCTAGCDALMNSSEESACLTADNVRNEEKFRSLFTDHRTCWKCCPPTRRHSSHRRKKFWFSLGALL